MANKTVVAPKARKQQQAQSLVPVRIYRASDGALIGTFTEEEFEIWARRHQHEVRQYIAVIGVDVDRALMKHAFVN
jgi:hypothetical protein